MEIPANHYHEPEDSAEGFDDVVQELQKNVGTLRGSLILITNGLRNGIPTSQLAEEIINHARPQSIPTDYPPRPQTPNYFTIKKILETSIREHIVRPGSDFAEDSNLTKQILSAHVGLRVMRQVTELGYPRFFRVRCEAHPGAEIALVREMLNVERDAGGNRLFGFPDLRTALVSSYPNAKPEAFNELFQNLQRQFGIRTEGKKFLVPGTTAETLANITTIWNNALLTLLDLNELSEIASQYYGQITTGSEREQLIMFAAGEEVSKLMEKQRLQQKRRNRQ